MHYRANAFAIRTALYNLTTNYFRTLPVVTGTRTQRFDRNDFLDAMERLDAF